MRITAIWALLIALFLNESCSDLPKNLNKKDEQFIDKEILNNEWKKQGVSENEWYYRLTVIEAPANTKALGIADGHWLHPEVIRFEITKDLLIGWRAYASILNAEHELHASMKKHYRGAPVVVFPIVEHFDIDLNQNKLSNSKPWFERQFITVDWSNNLVEQFKRNDSDEGIYKASLNDSVQLIDDSWKGNPKRIRIGTDFIDFTTRHPVAVSYAAYNGAYGEPFRGDSAACVIDIRHFFMKKPENDFIPLPYPDSVKALNENNEPILDNNGNPKLIDINKRFGMLRTNFNGHSVYDQKTGTIDEHNIVNATIFNIWQKNKNDSGAVIPIEERIAKPIIYYMNVLHPESLKKVSFDVAKEWDMAFKNAVFYAQPNKYVSINDVPSMWIIKENNCHIDNVSFWLKEKRLDLKDRVELVAKVTLPMVEKKLYEALANNSQRTFSEILDLEIKAKRELEQICSALEFFTANSQDKFIYQRPGDLRFNLLNLEMENNTTEWSGYGPMMADPLTGEIISATANINMKYIDLRAQQIAKLIGLLKEKMPGLKAVFGSGVAENSSNLINPSALTKVHEYVRELKQSPNLTFNELEKSTISKLDRNFLTSLSAEEKNALHNIKLAINNKTLDHKKANEFGIFGIKNTASSHKESVMDPINFVDDIAIGVAIKYANLSDHERFMKIRKKIYKSVALHEIGHNAGLRHNMASSSDALNYGKNYWLYEQLPSDLITAKSMATDRNMINKLQQCIEEENSMQNELMAYLKRNSITTQECLQQKNGMYSSVMGYHASPLAGIKGLGLYDKAAIKWAYGQVVEIFPKDNLKINSDGLAISRWLTLNNHRDIPKFLLKDIKAINQRNHVKIAWDKNAINTFPSNSVPYTYCDDPYGLEGPRCLAFDFGPDMQSSALWLKSRYSQQFFLTHFAKDSSWPIDDPKYYFAAIDIDILNRFTNMLRWYYQYINDDKEFKGSYREQDYLKALSIGLNHFSHVIGLPESGAHITAPMWTLEEQRAVDTNIDRLSPTNIFISLNNLSECNVKSVTKINEQGQVIGRLGYYYLDVPLGIGRPLRPAISDDIENKFILYHGSLLTKKYALYLLTAPLFKTRSSETIEKNDLLSMTWYRMFPKAIGKIYSAVIRKNYEELGPLINEYGFVSPRNVIDEHTLKLIKYENQMSILPSMDDSLSAFASENAISFIPKTINQEFNLLRSIKISCRGCSDDIDYANTDEGTEIVRYTHLSGDEYKALKFSHMPSIGADLLLNANQQKEHYLRLNECLKNENKRASDPFCQCIKTIDRKSYDHWECCEEKNQNCSGPKLEPVGYGTCSIDDLKHRMNQSIDQLNAMVGFIDHIRILMKNAGM